MKNDHAKADDDVVSGAVSNAVKPARGVNTVARLIDVGETNPKRCSAPAESGAGRSSTGPAVFDVDSECVRDLSPPITAKLADLCGDRLVPVGDVQGEHSSQEHSSQEPSQINRLAAQLGESVSLAHVNGVYDADDQKSDVQILRLIIDAAERQIATLRSGAAPRWSFSGSGGMTLLQRKIWDLWKQGKDTYDIGSELDVSEAQVARHLDRLLEEHLQRKKTGGGVMDRDRVQITLPVREAVCLHSAISDELRRQLKDKGTAAHVPGLPVLLHGLETALTEHEALCGPDGKAAAR